jgi:hypothetical protein
MLVYVCFICFQPSVGHSWAGRDKGQNSADGGAGQRQDPALVRAHADQERRNVSRLSYSNSATHTEKSHNSKDHFHFS